MLILITDRIYYVSSNFNKNKKIFIFILAVRFGFRSYFLHWNLKLKGLHFLLNKKHIICLLLTCQISFNLISHQFVRFYKVFISWSNKKVSISFQANLPSSMGVFQLWKIVKEINKNRFLIWYLLILFV